MPFPDLDTSGRAPRPRFDSTQDSVQAFVDANRQVLATAVRAVVGRDDVPPRPGQAALSDDVAIAFCKTRDTQGLLGGRHVGEAGTGVGKALDVETPIPTPAGIKRMGDLVPGDEVFDENGRICRVVEAFAVRHDRPCYEVEFDDGATIVADGEHLWSTSTRARRSAHAERRRLAAAPLSAYRRDRVAFFAGVLTSIEQGHGSSVHSSGSLAALLAPYDVGKAIAAGRQEVGVPTGAREFDATLVLKAIIGASTRGSALAKPLDDLFQVVTTDEIRTTLRGQSNALNHAVPIAGALDLPDVDLPLDPYFLGAWLGDGSSRCSQITSADIDIVDEIRRRGFHVEKLRAEYLWSVRLSAAPVTSRWEDTVTGRLRDLDLLQNKHVPDRYLRASAAQRLDLLRGIVDTDGTVSRQNGRTEVCLTNERLARDTYALVASLGLKPYFRTGPASITENGERRAIGTRYRVAWISEERTALMSRKADLQRDQVSPRTHLRYIKDVRPVASRPVRCIAVDSPSHLFLAGEACVVTHNSLAYLAPAMTAAALHGERSVISTEMISLQTQIIDKDAPVVVDAVEAVTGKRPQVALLKGWSNYACLNAAVDAAAAELRTGKDASGPGSVVVMRNQVRGALRAAGAGPVGVGAADGQDTSALLTGPRGDDDRDPVARLRVIEWALDQGASHVERGQAPGSGDKNTFPGNLDGRDWDLVSVSSGDCIGAKKCPFADICLPGKAREAAADADVIVTNHHLLAVQAANAVPVVIGNKRLGHFDHIVVDEAHSLPSIVRSQGSVEVSSRRFLGLVRQFSKTVDTDRRAVLVADRGQSLGLMLDTALREWTSKAGANPGGQGSSDVVRLGEGDDPVEAVSEGIGAWLKAAGKILADHVKDSRGDQGVEMRSKRLRNRFAEFDKALELVATHAVGSARWVETKQPSRRAMDQTPFPAAQYAPVNVGSMLEYSLWSTDAAEEGTGGDGQGTGDARDVVSGSSGTTNDNDVTDSGPRRQLSAVALSATMPGGFPYQVSIREQVKKYASPFDGAYGASALFVPRAVENDDVTALSRDGSLGTGGGRAGRPKFDVSKHRGWAISHMKALVEANGGGAIVLSATGASGRAYAEALSKHAAGRWKVLSQWDGPPLRALVAEWKKDPTSVLVGAKSLMTGVDASGETCSLVIVDRPARAAGNPTDDARVEMLVREADMDKYAADRLVYVTDAAMLLEQAAGRLIRTISDSGMVAVLDPRLLKSGPFSYPEPTRRIYMEAVHRFPRKFAHGQEATGWLRTRRQGLEMSA